ncbi:MAG: T9SS type A sorting domain-containing protein [Armatimonadetes bacterium]|nr:T9SS type A sorting domain-containing protein [Armatimonadota bacterium]
MLKSMINPVLSGKTLILFFVLLVVTTCLYSTIINVPADQPTIQNGIYAAVDADTVLVAEGTYEENINFDGKNIVVASNYIITQDTVQVNQTIIDGNQNGTVVTFENGENDTAVLTGFTITNGSGNQDQFGGGIVIVNESQPTLEYLVITENTALRGAGIYCNDFSELTMNSVLLSYNVADNIAGGIYCINSNMHLENCVFYENEAISDHSGAINYYVNSDNLNIYDVEIEHCYFMENQSPGTAGVGVYLADGLNTTIEAFVRNSYFLGNSSMSNTAFRFRGEGVIFELTNCTISENEAVNYTAGGAFNTGSTGKVMNCLFSSNIANTGGSNWNSGGPTVWSGANVDFVNCTFVDNSAASGAGLTVGGGGIATLTNCIFWGNSFEQIGLTEQNDQGGTLTVNYCDVQDGIDSIGVSPLSTLNWGAGNIDEDPLFVGTGDYPFSLQDLSPCVNTGIPDTTGLNLPEYDLAENPRVYGGRIDMGAYENQNVVVGANDDLIPLATKLNQNYPNPFNPTTTIEFSIEQNEQMELEIYNLKGQKIRQFSIFNGQSSIVWDGTDQTSKPVSSGIYFYKLNVNEETEAIRKMILLK